jgi:hypothetical protein
VADSADQTIVIELLSKISDAVQGINQFADQLGNSLKAGADQAEGALTGIEERAKETGDKLGEAGESAGRSFGQGLTLVAAAFAAQFLDTMRDTIDKASEYASNIGTLSLITGDDPKKLQEFEFAMRGVGVSSEQSTQQLAMMQNRIVEAAQKTKDTSSVFYQLGISAKSMVGNDAITNFQLLADKISNLRTQTEQTRAASELFGERLGAKLLPILTQGKTGIQDLMGQADNMGAIIPPELISRLEDLDGALKQLDQSTQAFFINIAAPLIPVMTSLAEATMRFYQAVENLSSEQKLAILFAALSASFLAFEQGLETVGSFFAKNLISRELLDFLEDWNVILKALVVTVGVFAVAYQTNFAGVRTAVQGFGNAFSDAFERASEVMAAARDIVLNDLAPAFEHLSAVLGPLVAEAFGNLSNGIESIPWDDILAGIDNTAKAFAALIDDIANIIDWMNRNRSTVEAYVQTLLSLAAAVGTGGAVFVGLLALKQLIADVSLGFALAGVNSVRALAEALTTYLVEGANAAIVALTGVSVAEAAATFGISALVAGLVYLLLNFDNVANFIQDTWITAWNHLKDGFSELLDSIANDVDAIGTFLDTLHDLSLGLIQSGDDAHTAAQGMRDYADSINSAASEARRLALEKKNLADGNEGGGFGGGPDTTSKPLNYGLSGISLDPQAAIDAMFPNGKPKDDGGTHGAPSSLNAPQKASGDAERSKLDAIKDAVDAAKLAFAQMENAVKMADLAIAALGKNASPAQIAAAYAEKLRAANAELVAQARLVGALGAARNAANALGASAGTAKDARADHDAARGYAQEQQQAVIKETELNQELNKVRAAGLEAQRAYYADKEKTAGSYGAEIKALEQELSITEKLRSLGQATNADVLAAREKILKTYTDAAEAAQKEHDLATSIAIARIKTQEQIDTQDAAVAGPKKGSDDGADKEAGQLAQDIDAITIATMQNVDAQNAQAQALRELNAQKQVGDIEAITAAQAKYDQAVEAATSAQNALTVAQNAYKDDQVQTSQKVTQTRDAFAKLIESGIGGTLDSLFQGLQGSTVNLTQGFISLFEQSRSFHDIQQAFEEITSRLAQVFDALRPVVDFLLGILIGITDVFLEMFNIIAEVLNVLGLHIQKIQLLNDTLNGLNNDTKPLLQITHDLPTMNEYNSGKWASLEGQQNPNDEVMQGFDQMSTGIGQIVGILIGIKLLMGLMMGQSLAQQTAGPVGWIKGLFGLGGKKADPSTDKNNQLLQQNNENTQQNSQANQTTASGLTTVNSALDSNNSAVAGNNTVVGQLITAIQNLTAQMQQAASSAAQGGGNALTKFAQSIGMSSSDDDAMANAELDTPASDVGADAVADQAGNPGGVASTQDYSAFTNLDTTTKTASTATTQLNGTMMTLTSLIPNLTSILGSKIGGVGGSLVSAAGSIAGIFGTMAKMKAGASTGSLDTGNYISGGLELFQGLSQGGTASQTLGGIGDIAGTIFGGPIGGAIGNALGTVIGSFFGPHLSAYKNPDIDDTQNYGQDVANIEGTAGANGQSFTESSGLSQVFGGQTGESAIEEELSKGMATFMKDTGLSAADYNQDLQDFGASATGSGTAVHGKNIGDISFSGVEGQSGTHRYDALNAALEQFAQGLETATGNLANAFGNENVNLASLYGNGQVVTTGGGYSVGGASPTSGNPTAGVSSSVTITIAPGTGLSQEDATAALQPVLTQHASDLARIAAQTSRNSGNIQGRT